MNTLRSRLGISTNQSYGDIGLEVETEYSRNVIDDILRTIPLGWTPHRDNSLRNNGIEYTTNGPIRMVDKYTLLKAFTDFISRLPVQQSPRTSFHVHINVLDKTPLSVVTAITAYWILEDILFEMCGKYRRGNLFCLSAKDATSVVRDLIQDVRSARYFHTFTQDSHKYGALNLAAIINYGTLEVRSMDGKLDLERMNTWVDLLYEIITFNSTAHKNPADLLNKLYETLYVKKSPRDALKCLIETPHLQDVLFKLVGNSEERLGRSLMDGVIMCRPIAYGVLDWDRVYSDTPKPNKSATTTEVAPPRPRTRNRNANTAAIEQFVHAVQNNDTPPVPREMLQQLFNRDRTEQ